MNDDHRRLVNLEPPTPALVEASDVWFGDPELRRLTRSAEATLAERQSWLASLGSRSDYRVWEVHSQGALVGAVGLRGIAGQQAESFIHLGSATDRGRGVGRQAMLLLIEQARLLGLARIAASVGTDNPVSQRFHESVGFAVLASDSELVCLHLDLLSSP